MSKSWRPIGWENPYPMLLPDRTTTEHNTDWVAYEAGASAILEALRTVAKKSKGSMLPTTDFAMQGVRFIDNEKIDGIWVFIPDDDTRPSDSQP